MTMLVMDGFDFYGEGTDGRLKMLDGVWAEIHADALIETPSWDTENRWLKLGDSNIVQSATATRRVLPAAQTTLFTGFRVYLDALPSTGGSIQRMLCSFRDGTNAWVVYMSVGTTGTLEVYDVNDVLLGVTSGPVITAAAANYVEIKTVRDASSGEFRVRVNDVEVLTLSSLNLGANDIAQIGFWTPDGPVNVDGFIKDLIFFNDSGSYNINFLGDVQVATVYPVADTATDGWTAQPRKKFDEGILFFKDNPGTPAEDNLVTFADDTEFELGSADFTIEKFVRFFELPTGSNKAIFMSKWDEASNNRSFEFYKGGPSLDGGNVVFRISTDGTAGTVSKLIDFPWDPDANHWYHLALSRDSGTLRFFIDGIQYGGDVADANTYDDNAALLSLGAEAAAASDDDAFVGFMDEIRMTPGVARYTANFTVPSAKFGRDVGGDSDFASVSLLMGMDSASVADESSNAFVPVTVGPNTEAFTVDDGDASFEVVDQRDPRDDTFLEAALIPAIATLTLTANPADTETVTLGSQTYTFVNSLTGADDVLIGANADESLDNLIAAVNGGAGEGSIYGTSTVANVDISGEVLPGDQALFSALVAGTAGNTLDSTETLTNGSFGDTTFDGGQDIPGSTELVFGVLPPLTTVVRAVGVTGRLAKSDAGPCQVQMGFEVADGSGVNGADRSITAVPTYYTDIVEEDPSTSAGLTPSSMVNARIRLNRTV